MSELIDNRAKRIRTLKRIIKQLHGGADPASVRAELTAIVRATDAGEIAAMEQELIAEGMPVEEIKSMCDLHAQVVQDILAQPSAEALPPGHPADTIRRENEALRALVAGMRAIMQTIKTMPPDADAGPTLLQWRRALNDLMDVDKHYRRKEDLFFSCLERHGISGPSKVMWAVHDEIRQRLKTLERALAEDGLNPGRLAVVVDEVAADALMILEAMTRKEEQILLPMMLQTLTEEEWGEIWQQSPRYGWCLVEPRAGYTPPQAAHPEKTIDLAGSGAVQFPTGSLDFEQLLGIFAALPVDLTFVDAEDRVRFFSEGPERIFSRSKAIIGRKVQHCHPPKSVNVVEQILADFRAGRQDVAEFWISHQDKFVHIRYFAVRDQRGAYLGTLEVTQDLTRLRALEGERRLLQYESAPGGKPA
jgi:DUF438 domain-containing protein